VAVESCADVLAWLVTDGPDIREAVVGVAHDLGRRDGISKHFR
jgi:hypothetical protein